MNKYDSILEEFWEWFHVKRSSDGEDMVFRSLLYSGRINWNYIYIYFGVWKICENYMGRLLGVCSLFTNFLGLENGFITFCVQ